MNQNLKVPVQAPLLGHQVLVGHQVWLSVLVRLQVWVVSEQLWTEAVIVVLVPPPS